MSVAPAAAAIAPVPGLNALLLPLLMSFGPAVLNKLFGGDPQGDLRRKINALLTPQMLARLTDQFYRQNLQSPAYSQAQGAIATGANQTANTVAANLAARGIGTSGTGAVLSGLTPSLVGSQTAGLRTAAYESGQAAARENIQRQIEALTGTRGPSQTQQFAGAGIEAFQPYLQAYLRAKYPSLAAGWVPAAAR